MNTPPQQRWNSGYEQQQRMQQMQMQQQQQQQQQMPMHSAAPGTRAGASGVEGGGVVYLEELHRIRRIPQLMNFLDYTLRTSSWPSASSDASAALYKMGNLALVDTHVAGKVVVRGSYGSYRQAFPSQPLSRLTLCLSLSLSLPLPPLPALPLLSR